jgi:hypothetical protein
LEVYLLRARKTEAGPVEATWKDNEKLNEHFKTEYGCANVMVVEL